MRDFRDAKVMAHILRAAPCYERAQGHQQRKELIAQAFGVADWNTLSAAIREEAGGLRNNTPAPQFPTTSTMHRALANARQRKHQYATLEHLLLALIDDVDACAVMKACKVDLGALKEKLTKYIDNDLKTLAIDDGDEPQHTPGVQRVVQRAANYAEGRGRPNRTGQKRRYSKPRNRHPIGTPGGGSTVASMILGSLLCHEKLAHEVRAQEHCDYASIIKVQGAFDELSRQTIGWIGDDRADTRPRCPTQEVHALSDVAPDHVETSLLERRDHLAAAACWLSTARDSGEGPHGVSRFQSSIDRDPDRLGQVPPLRNLIGDEHAELRGLVADGLDAGALGLTTSPSDRTTSLVAAAIAVLDPLINISMHVVEPEGIRLFFADGMYVVAAVLSVVTIARHIIGSGGFAGAAR
jgi:hypothetical protein